MTSSHLDCDQKARQALTIESFNGVGVTIHRTQGDEEREHGNQYHIGRRGSCCATKRGAMRDCGGVEMKLLVLSKKLSKIVLPERP
ncbi:hypothetical protein NL676_022741 [Syzygium grande]|nr:hypothetical protein NL676_022741 [Syzygium grande]